MEIGKSTKENITKKINRKIKNQILSDIDDEISRFMREQVRITVGRIKFRITSTIYGSILNYHNRNGLLKYTGWI